MKNPLILSLFVTATLALSACVTGETEPTIVTPGGGDQAEFRPCRVEDYQSYVGRNRSEIPAAPAGQTFRVLCETCAATMDYRENRVNFVYDSADIVSKVKCG